MLFMDEFMAKGAWRFMPELPEVETVRRILGPQVAGRRISKVELRRPEVVAHPSPEVFCDGVTGATFSGMGRRGKFLLLNLADGGTIVLHLRMTGQLLVTPAGFPEEKHTHAVFHLDDGNELRFVDTRRFGRLWLLGAGEQDMTGMGKLGPEPFDAACCADHLRTALGRRKKTIKECLLDQTVVAGIGNIYADEILYAVKLNPHRSANSLSAAEWRTLSKEIPRSLKIFIEKNAMTPEEYLAGLGKEYRNTPFLSVYGRKDLPCPRCGTPLVRAVIGGRGSHYCPHCQPDESA